LIAIVSSLSREHLRTQSSFLPQFLLGPFEDAIVDDPIYGHLLVHEAVADIFIQHELDAIHGDGQIRGEPAEIKIIGLADDFRVPFETGFEARFDRLLP